MASYDMLTSPVPAQSRQGEDAIDVSLASALQRNMSFAEDRKRQHTPSTANRPRRVRKADLECEDEQKENSNPSASSSTNKVTPSRLVCIKQLEQEMTCSVCLDICVRPCTTPCGHDFCRKCLKQALRHQRRCPKCRTNIPASAPICINTVLWNTIKLLFPHHAANAPESPADAILTPSRSNTAAMAHALAAVPNAVMRQMANAPFNPPRRTRALSPNRPAIQRMPPSWLEGATRDSDPPDPSARRHRLALSSRNHHHQQQQHAQQQQQQQQQQAHQQTLPQAFGRWEVHAAPPAQGQDLNMDDPHVQAMQPVLVQPRRRYGPGNQPLVQQPAALSRQRPNTQDSLLDNLQRRLDTLPIPDVLHASQRLQETAAGMEHSPSLRIRSFGHRPHQRQTQASAAASNRLTNVFVRRNQPVAQLHAARQPVLDFNPHPAVQQFPAVMQQQAEQQWQADDLPDTPEAPRAATAAQNQAIADSLFEAAAGESAVAESDIQADPSWLDDAAAYDAAAADLDTDGLDALEILSEDDDDVHGSSATARAGFVLNGLDQLVLSSDSEDDSIIADSIALDDEPVQSSSDTPQQTRLWLLQQALRSGAAPASHQLEQASALPLAAAASGEASGSSATLSGRAEQTAPAVVDLLDSPPPMAAGHSGMPRPVLSDVSSSFPPEQPQQQGDQSVAAAPAAADKPFNLQRRRRLVCREPSHGPLNAAEQLASASSSVSGTQAAAPSESTALETLSQSAQDGGATAQQADLNMPAVVPAVARCTRSQARRNKQPSLPEHASLRADSAAAHQARSSGDAASAHGNVTNIQSQMGSSSSQSAQVQQAGVNRLHRQAKSRPRLQLNRVARHE